MKRRSTAAAATHSSDPPALAEKIVGIGASAGGLEAFTDLVRNLPLDLNIAYILVQHLDPSHRSLLSELLSRATQLRVREITNNTRVEGNQIYVIPPNSDLSITQGVLRLSPRKKSVGPARSIDNFLTSLAMDQKDKSIAVILSGAGSDGAQGLRAVKAAGGITFAQDEGSAKYDSMPRAAVGTGCVDFVLPPDKIAEELLRIVRYPERFKSRVAANAKSRLVPVPSKVRFGNQPLDPVSLPLAPGDANLRKIFQLLRNKTGLDFSSYKRNTIRRRLARRLSLNKVRGFEAYVRFLRQHPAELDLLHQDLLIGVTSFFRNPLIFEQLKQKIFPRLTKSLGSDSLRVWTAGCSTGQEAYSIAMAYQEFVEKTNVKVPLQIFASDVNGAVLDFARTGRYSKEEVQSVPPSRLARFFSADDGHFRVIKSLRDLIIFAQHNLLSDPPFTRVDLISCRNMLIYFDAALQQKILPAFHYALKPNGILLLGASESIGSFHNLFGTIEAKHRIYIKKPASNWPRFDRPLKTSVGKKLPITPATKPQFNPVDAQKEADRVVLQKFAPPGVLINAEGEILQFRGEVGRFLKLPTGKASFHVSKIARDGLALPLERALLKAKRERRVVRDHGVCVGTRHEFIDLQVIPLKLESTCYLVLFSPVAPPQKNSGTRSVRVSANEAKQLVNLKDELGAAREHINSLQEEHDTSIEELQASNEEVQSANEELQSLNEELETSNEELESANEELTTLNEELATRNSELRESETRLREQATLLEMAPLLARSSKDRIILWSRGAERMYGFTAEEALGQTAHILLDTKAAEPLAKLSAKVQERGAWEGEVTHRRKDGRRLHVATQWVVHNDAQKKVHAVLEVCTDITTRKEAEEALRQSEEFNRTILESSPDCIKVLDGDGRVIFINAAGRKLLETGDSETRAKSYWPGLWIGEAREHAEKAYRAALGGKSAHFVGFRYTPKGTPKWWDVVVRPIGQDEGKPERILAVLRDITEHKKQQVAVAERMQLAALRAEVAAETAGNAALQSAAQRISESLVNDLELALVRIWACDEGGELLTMQSSAGTHTQVRGAEARLPMGSGRIGRIASHRKPYFTNNAQSDPELKNPDGIHHQHLTSFAGYPLLVGDCLVGVLAVYGKNPLSEAILGELAFAAKAIAQFVQRKQTNEKLLETQAELSRYNEGLEKLVTERTAALQQLVEQMEEFSYSISHDLRAPARAMEAYASVLLEDYGAKLDPTGREYLERIRRSSSRMDRMIREILTYSKLSRCQVSLKPVALKELIREIVEQTPGIQPFAAGIEVDPALADVMGHEQSLVQAISNLLSNACKFVARDTTPKCKIWTEQNNGHVRLNIKDNGIGIKPEHQHRLFGVFERLHPDKSYEGNGIGLAIVRKAVERMGGRVGVDSDGVNGSRFWIELRGIKESAKESTESLSNAFRPEGNPETRTVGERANR